MTHSQLDAMMAESGLDPEEATELADLLAPLADLCDEAPAPSGELVEFFGGDTSGTRSHEPRSLRQRQRSRGTLAGVVVLALSGVGATGLSAAANTLPSAWQHQVAGFSHRYLPFDFPEPPDRKPRHSIRAPGASSAEASEPGEPAARLEVASDATRSATRLPYIGAAAWQGGPAGPGIETRDERTGTTSATTGSPASAGGGPGEHSSGEQHVVRGSGQTPRPTPSTGQDESATKDREKDRERNRGKVKDDDSANDRSKGSANDQDEYDRSSDRPVRGGGLGNPRDPQRDPQKGKPTVGDDQGASDKNRAGEKSHEQDGPPGNDGDDERPGERTLPDQVRDALSSLPQVAQVPLRGEVPRT